MLVFSTRRSLLTLVLVGLGAWPVKGESSRLRAFERRAQQRMGTGELAGAAQRRRQARRRRETQSLSQTSLARAEAQESRVQRGGLGLEQRVEDAERARRGALALERVGAEDASALVARLSRAAPRHANGATASGMPADAGFGLGRRAAPSLHARDHKM